MTIYKVFLDEKLIFEGNEEQYTKFNGNKKFPSDFMYKGKRLYMVGGISDFKGTGTAKEVTNVGRRSI